MTSPFASSGFRVAYTLQVPGNEVALPDELLGSLKATTRARYFREQNEKIVACSRSNMLAFVRHEPSTTGDAREFGGPNHRDSLRSRHCVYVINANAPSQFEVPRALTQLVLFML